MSTKRTLSKDGKYRVSLRTQYRLDDERLAILLIKEVAPYTVAPDDAEDSLPDMKVGDVRERIRERLYQHGVEVEGWSDEMGKAEQESWLEWALRQVRRAYPEDRD